MAAKLKLVYTCQKCEAQFPKWAGQCSECQAWNSLVEAVATKPCHHYPHTTQALVTTLSQVVLTTKPRLTTMIRELDRVLGGGIVAGGVVLIGGSPGIGKSTLLLQATAMVSQSQPVLYVSGEESLQQVALRAKRLHVPCDQLKLVAETRVERIIALAKSCQPKLMVVDSVQTIFSETLSLPAGSISQVRGSAANLVDFAKQSGTAIFLVGHVTKEGAIAGPRVLEHMVDTVLYFEDEQSGRFRLLRAVKNRFGAVNELGIFAMTDQGLKAVSNPSAIFVSRQIAVSGRVITAVWEGSRPLLVEIQALVDESKLANPRRIAVGLDYNRLAMLLAVLHRHGNVFTHNQDIFVNVVGGVRILETSADLSVILTVFSSLRDKVLAADLMVFGEVGLSGEIRPVQSGQKRLQEALKHGFKRAIVPQSNMPKVAMSGLEVIGVRHLSAALAAV